MFDLIRGIRAKREAKRRRREIEKDLGRSHHDYLNQTFAGIWSESNGDIGEAERLTKATLEAHSAERGFDPATIMLLVQLALLVYKALKYFGFFKADEIEVYGIFEASDGWLIDYAEASNHSTYTGDAA